MSPISKNDPLRRWFSAMIETSFQEKVGVCSPQILDYLAELLTEFIHIERINSLCEGSDHTIEDITEMLFEAELKEIHTPIIHRREFHRHIGDCTLFWTGVYPENLKKQRRRNARDDLINYFQQGKRSYAIASRLSSDTTHPPASVLQLLSDQFEYCVYGLGLVRKEWEKHDDQSKGDIDLLTN